MFNTQLLGGNGNKVAAAVSAEQELCVIAAPYPPLATQKVQPFRQFLTTNGESSGTADMGVDGSSTNVDYYVPAIEGVDRYITTLSFIMGYGASGKPYQWANGTPLSNGCRLFYGSRRGEVDIHEGITTNQDFFRLSFSPVIGDWEVQHVNANQDFGYFITMDLTKLGLPFGVKLDRDTSQHLTMRIRDNVGLDADSFNCIAYGFDRFE